MATFSNRIFEKQYATGDDEKTTRTIGLEIETSINDTDSELYRSKPGTIQSKIQQLEDIFPVAGAGTDGDEYEFVTHPDSITLYKQGGSERLKKVMKYLKRYSIDPLQLTNSGIHVNVGILPTDDQEYIMDNIYWIIMNFAVQLQKIAGRISSWSSLAQYGNTKLVETEVTPASDVRREYYCTTEKPDTVKKRPALHDKHAAVVLKEYTYEFRIFRTSNSLNEVLAWAELCNNIVQLAAGEKETINITFQDLIKGKYIGKYAKSLKGRRQLSIVEMKASVENTLSFQFFSTAGTKILK